MDYKSRHILSRIAFWLLYKMTSRDIRYAVLGDFEELFEEKYSKQGFLIAGYWLWFQVIKSSPKFFTDKIYWGVVMFKNYIKISFRNMIRNKTYSIINIMGLAIGMAACLIIGTYVLSEMSYDKFHKKSENIYRVTTLLDLGSNPIHIASSNYPAAPELKEKYPEVLDAVRFKQVYSSLELEYDDEKIIENGFLYADQSVFNVFSFNLKKGDPETALKNPYSIVITEELADKIFGQKNPVGKVLIVNNDSKFTVTGVVEDPPINSHIRFSMLGSFVTLKDVVGEQYDKWTGDFQNFTYLLLNNENNAESLQAKLPEVIDHHIGDLLKHVSGRIELHLEPFDEIYLHSEYVNQFGPSGDIGYTYIFSAIAFLILTIACVNFMNLSTARSMTRALEIGIRKVHGANKSQLIFQFIGESLFFAVISFVLSLMIIPILWPIVYEFSGLDLSILTNDIFTTFLIGFTLITIVGFLAGLYPAIYLSTKNLYDNLKSKSGSNQSSQFRKVLVIIQFVVSITLIGSTGIINDQLEYVRNKNLGYQKDNILVVPVNSRLHQMGVESVKAELLKHSEIFSVATGGSIPGEGARHNVFQPEDRTAKESVRFAAINADYDYLNTLKLQIKKGRNFSKRFTTDPEKSIIINEAAAKALGWENPIGKTIKELDGRGINKTVIGVVNDFHYGSLNQVLEPLIIENETNRTRNYILSISENKIQETIKHIENILKDKNSEREFNYFFLDEMINSQLSFVDNLQNMFSYFTFLAIFLACIGLFGLASFSAEQRTKEIGIRKVLGSSVSSIVALLSKEFIKWVIIGNLIALPIIWWSMSKWLEDFIYKTEISIVTILLAGLIALGISIITVSFITLKSAKANPVDSLKYE